ncbi:MAG: hypothetical protein AAGE43_01005 [Pseudomonadota bacterium]
MDLNNLKKVLGIGLLSAAAIANTPATAATGNVTVDVDLPTVLIMYYYSDIELDLDQASLGSWMVGATGVACGTDFCADSGDAGAYTVSGIGATNAVAVTGLATPDFEQTAMNIELQNIVGVRAIGCPTGVYDADYDVSGDAGIGAETDVPVTNIDGEDCSAAITTGNLDFDLNLANITPGATNVAATLAVTIVGI